MNRRNFLTSTAALSLLHATAEDAPYKTGKGWKPLLNGRDVTGWHGAETEMIKGGSEWMTVQSVRLDNSNPKALAFEAGQAGVLLNGPKGKTVNLVSDEKSGDCELYVEFMIPKGSNSGVYVQGLYEIQIFDSYGVAQPKDTDCGAIYHRWIENKPVGGSAPRVNASRPPGEWQFFHAWFQAPRFTNGRKTQDARFVRVVQNGKVVQENVSVNGGTRSHLPLEEASSNPLMLQGDHGPVAFRNIYVRQA